MADVQLPPQTHNIMPTQVTSIEQANKIINDMIKRYDEDYRLLRNYVENGLANVNLISRIAEPIDSYFNREIGSFSLAADTPMSTVTTLEYQFTASPGHGIILSNEILLLDTVADRAIQCVVTGVAGDIITVDRPIDHIYPALPSTLGRIVSSNMNIDGSVTPVIFTYRAGVKAAHITRMFLTGLSSASMDYTKFMGRTALPNGIVFRVVDGFQKTIFNFKTNRELAQFCYDVNLEGKAPAGQFGLAARVSFGGEDKHGTILEAKDDTVYQWIVQDDLSTAESIEALQASVEGHFKPN